MKAVTRSEEHKWKELIICILQRILEDLGGIAKLMGFTQDVVNSKDVEN